MCVQTGESGEAEQALEEAQAGAEAGAGLQGPWERERERLDWEQGSQDSMEKGQREQEGKRLIPFLGMAGAGALSVQLFFVLFFFFTPGDWTKMFNKKYYKPQCRKYSVG